jgi:stage III sporulation protein AG
MKRINCNVEALTKGLKKYKYALLVLLLGMALLLIPTEKKAEPVLAVQEEEDYGAELERRLTDILSTIEGVGRVEVALTLQRDSYTHYHQDLQQSETSEEWKTVILSEGSAYDKAAVTTVDYPRFQGALIVCQGGGNAAVQLRLVEAVAALTGLGSDRIKIVKMK